MRSVDQDVGSSEESRRRTNTIHHRTVMFAYMTHRQLRLGLLIDSLRSVHVGTADVSEKPVIAINFKE